MSALPQQLRSVTEIVVASFNLYTESFTKVIGYSLILFAINHVIGEFITSKIPANTPLAPELQATIISVILQLLPSLLATFVCSYVLYNATIYRIDNVAQGREDDFIAVLLQSVKKFPTIFFAIILYSIAIIIGSFLLVIPGIILIISLSFSWYFVLLEDI